MGGGPEDEAEWTKKQRVEQQSKVEVERSEGVVMERESQKGKNERRKQVQGVRQFHMETIVSKTEKEGEVLQQQVRGGSSVWLTDVVGRAVCVCMYMCLCLL